MSTSRIIGGNMLPEKPKVYCKRCKYVDMYHLCMKNPNVVDTWHDKVTGYSKCNVKNEDNDCPDFEPSLWQRIKQWLSR